MTSLLTAIYNELLTVTSKIYLENAPSNATFPYVSFNAPTSIEIDGCVNGDRVDFIVEVDVWDNIKDTTRLETLTDNINSALHRCHINNTNVAVSIYRINRLMIKDPDENIRRRQLRYRLLVWFK